MKRIIDESMETDFGKLHDLFNKANKFKLQLRKKYKLEDDKKYRKLYTLYLSRKNYIKNDLEDDVKCNFCGCFVKPQSLKAHQKTKKCLKARFDESSH